LCHATPTPYLELLDAQQDVLIVEKNNIAPATSSLIAKITFKHLAIVGGIN
jgi:hypothetical protein